MNCEICGSPGSPLHGQGMHDPAILCRDHTRAAVDMMLTDDVTLLWCLMAMPMNVESEPIQPIIELVSPMQPLSSWIPPTNQPTGASPQSGRPQFRSGSWVTAFTHKATDPRKTWPTR